MQVVSELHEYLRNIESPDAGKASGSGPGPHGPAGAIRSSPCSA